MTRQIENGQPLSKQAHKARRCDSYLQFWNYESLTDLLTHPLTGVSAWRCNHIWKKDYLPFANMCGSKKAALSTCCCISNQCRQKSRRGKRKLIKENIANISLTRVHCCTPSLCYLGHIWVDDYHRNPSLLTRIQRSRKTLPVKQ